MELRVRLVEELFDQLEKESNTFRLESKLYCRSGCGKCCSTPDISASPLEFLPWALHIFKTNKADEMLAELANKSNSYCLLYQTTETNRNNGSCSNYKYRGLICRLFGYAASRDKYGELRLSTCSIIKEEQTENYNKTQEAITNGLTIPVYTNYYMQLAQIDPRMAENVLPINKAMKMAIEEVLHYYAYRPLPEGMENIV